MKVAYIPAKRKRVMDCACAKCTGDASGANVISELERQGEYDDYMDLIERLTRAIEQSRTIDYYRAWMTGDEDEGHPFHGNQYTGGLGAKPTETKVTGVKSGVHELLSSGHGFSMEELQKATGATTIKQISDALAMLKNPKYAGAKGVLKIEKKGNEFFVTNAAGVPVAPPVAPAEQPKPEVPALAEIGAAPTGYLLAGQGNTTAMPLSTPMTKPEADAVYAESMKHGMALVANYADGHNQQSAAKMFKNIKAAQMAQWKANTTGAMVHAKPQDVYEADKQLVDDLVSGIEHDKALADWKANTAKEKAGTWPASVVEAKQAALAEAQKAALAAAGISKAQVETQQAELAAAASTEYAPHFEPIHDYVPDTHEHIGAADFLDNKFKSEISSLYSKLQEGHTNAVGNKVDIQHALTERLKDSKAFQTLSAMHKKSKGLSLEATLISAWASTSANTHPVSICNQIAVREAFGMDADDVAVGAASSHLKADDDGIHHQAANQLGYPISTPAQLATFKAGMRDFALAQYHNTQDHLKAKGIEHVYVARGMKTSAGITNAAQLATLQLQPASSFSANFSTAHAFAGHSGSMYFVKVPRSQVLSSYVTGFGCTNEHEVVVLAHPGTTAVKMKAAGYGSMAAADEHIKSTLVAQTPEMKAEYEANKAKKEIAKAKKEAKTAHLYKPPKKPAGAKAGGFAKEAYKLAQKNDLQGLKDLKEKAAKAIKIDGTTPTAKYINQLHDELLTHQVAKADAEWAAHPNKQQFDPDPEPEWEPYMSEPKAPVAPAGAQPAPAGTVAPVAATPASVGAFAHAAKFAPAHIAANPHFDPAQYVKWLGEGKTDQWVGKKLAMMKFQAKNKAMAEHVLGA